MRRLILAGFALALIVACTKKYLVNASLDPAFNVKRTYRIAIMPFLVQGAITPPSVDRDKAYDYLQQRLMETGKLPPIDKFTVEKAARMYEFGQSGKVDPALARQIAKDLGADLVCVAEATTEENEIVSVSVQIYPVEGASVIYSATARMANPASRIAAVGLALELATKDLVNKMK
jgi:uncharacterized ParB-like nuclease family protein